MKKRFFALSLATMAMVYGVEVESEATLNKIITSSTGFDMPIKDEPRNVVLIDKQTIINKGYKTLEDALKMAPLVTFSNNYFGNNIDLRGQGSSANTSVKVLINRVPINLLDTAHQITPLEQINLEDVESIEIIPGGGAVIYGNGTRGGVVNIVTKRNRKDYLGINLKGGIYEAPDMSGRIDIGGGRNIKNLFLKADASVSNTKGYRIGDANFNYYLSGEALYTFNEKQSLDFNVNYSYSKINSSTPVSLDLLGKNRRAEGKANLIENNFASTSLNYKAKFGENWDIDMLGFYEMSNVGNIKPSKSDFLNQAGGANLKAKWDIQKNSLMIGYDLLYQNNQTSSVIKNTMSDYKSTTNSDKFSNGVYIYDKYAVIKWFELSGGARYENSIYDRFNIKKYGSGNKGRNISLNDTETRLDYFDFKEAIQNNYALEITPNFKYSDTGNIYAKYERGFISPAPNQLYGKSASGVYFYNPVKSEIYDTFELGWRDEYKFSYLSATFYYTLSNNEINLIGNGHGPGGFKYDNIDQTARAGIEIVAYQDILNDRFHLSQSISYIYNEITKGVNKGKPIPLVQDYKFTFNIAYDFIKANGKLLSLFLNNAFYGPSVDNSYSQVDAYILSNLGLNFKISDFRIDIGVQNVFNAKYYTYHNAGTDFTSGYIPAPERSYYAEFRYGF